MAFSISIISCEKVKCTISVNHDIVKNEKAKSVLGYHM